MAVDGPVGPIKVYQRLVVAAALFSAMASTLNAVYQVTVIGLSPLQLVLVGTVLEAVIFLAEVPTGILADLRSRRLSVLVGFGLIGCGLAVGAIPAFETVLLAQILWGVGYAFTSGARDAWLADEIGADKAAKVFVRGTQLQLIGRLVGIIAAGLLGMLWIGLPIIVGGVGYLGLAAVLSRTMREDGFEPTPSAERSTYRGMRDQLAAGLRLARTRPAVRTLVVVSLIGGLASEAFDRLWTVHLLDLGIPSPFSGQGQVLLFAAIALIGTAIALLASYLGRRVLAVGQDRPQMLLAASTGVQALAVFVFAAAPTFWVALGMVWLRNSMVTLSYPVSVGWMNRSIESRVRATVMSIESQSNAVGQFTGGPALGAIGSLASVRTALISAAVVLSSAVGVLAAARTSPSPHGVSGRSHD